MAALGEGPRAIRHLSVEFVKIRGTVSEVSFIVKTGSPRSPYTCNAF